MNFAPVINIPKDWNIVELQTTGEVIYGIQASVANNTEPIGTKIITNKNISIDGKLIFEKQSYFQMKTPSHRKTLLKKGDILFNWRSGSQEHVGKTAYFDIDGEYIHSSFILRIRPNRSIINCKFLYYYLYWLRESKYFIKVHSYAINAKFNKSAVNSLPTILPTLEEQRKMAVVLSMVQDAIAQQEQLITLTTELKKALMHKLFTEGICSEPQKKTEIGFIPESWEIQKLGQITKLKSGGTPSREKLEYWNNGSIPWVKTTEIHYNLIQEAEESITQEGLDNSSANIFPKGTLLMAMYGQGVTRGRVAILDIDAATNQACVAITPKSENETFIKFLYYYFIYHYENLRQLGHGANQSNLSATILKGFPIAFPKLESQIQISDTLEKVDIKLEQNQQKRNCLTDLFRTILHQLMTAQIRVNDLNLSALNIELQGGDE